MGFFVHLWRLILSWTVFRRVEHERDEADDPHETEALPAPVLQAPESPEPLPPSAVLPLPASPGVEDDTEDDATDVVEPTAVVKPDKRALTIGADGWLIGAKVVKIPTTRGGYKFRTKSGRPGGCLWHWTATAWNTALTMAKRISTGSGSSVHVWIEHDGTIYQSAPFTKGTGHAGGDSSLRVSVDKNDLVIAHPESKLSINSFVLGFEIVCVGRVKLVHKVSDGSYEVARPGTAGAVWMGWPFGVWKKRPVLDKKTKRPKKDDKGEVIMERYVGTGPIVKDAYVVEVVGPNGHKQCYQDYTQGQVEAAERLVRAMHDKYPSWPRSMFEWGHIDVDPGRKSDPGPRWQKFWLPQILDRVLGG